MEKVYTYLTLAVMISFMFFISGVGTSGNSFSLIQAIIQGNITNSNLWVQIALVIAGIGITLGLSALIGNAGTAITAGNIAMSYFLITFVSDIIGIINVGYQTCDANLSGLCGVAYWLVAFICIPIAVGFGWSLYEMVVGSNN
jgi:hypothetical protein